jgi:hypothetical protein
MYQLAYLIWLGVLSGSLNIHRARYPWMDVNVVTPADSIQSKAQFLYQALKVPKGDIASTALDGLKRPFWPRHSKILIESKSLQDKGRSGTSTDEVWPKMPKIR